MSTMFILTLIAFFGLALLGMPVAFAMFVASVGYLIATGAMSGLFSEQILNGLYDSFVLLAVPLFILAANIMNASGVSDRLFMFCQASWVASGAVWLRSISWSASSSPACRGQPSPTRWSRQARHSDDDPAGQDPALALPHQLQLLRQRSGPSYRRPSRW
jgi:hypothetical protein